jgi:hypothetical protein
MSVFGGLEGRRASAPILGCRRRLGGWLAVAGLTCATVVAATPVVAMAAQGAASAPSVGDEVVPIVDPYQATAFEPPDGRWLVDEGGRQYTLFRWPKEGADYRFVDAQQQRIALRYGVELIVERSDERYLFLRWYRSEPVEKPAGGASSAPSSGTSVEAPVVPARQDRLQLVPWDEGLPRAGQWRHGFAVADFDGDGWLDVAHGPPRKNEPLVPVIFLGDGAGRFRQWGEARFPPLGYEYGDVAAGDLDGDGIMDLVLAGHRRGLLALLGDGGGGFRSWSSGLPQRPAVAASSSAAEPATTFTSRAIALADWDDDGRLDILALAEGPSSIRDAAGGQVALGKLILRNGGVGRWEAQLGPGDLFGDAIHPVDLDGDGRLDFVTDSRRVGSRALLNFGLAGGSWRVADLELPAGTRFVRDVVVADFDGDQRPDLAVATHGGAGAGGWERIDVLIEPAASSVRSAPVFVASAVQSGGITSLAAGDLDGDGDADLVALDAEGAVSLFVNAGTAVRVSRGEQSAAETGAEGAPPTWVLEDAPELVPDPEHFACAGYDAALVDLDRDGRAELIAAFAGESGSEVLAAAGALSTMSTGSSPRCRAGGALRVWKVRPHAP